MTPPPVHQQPMYDALASDCRTYVEIQGASHCQFAEYNLLCSLGETGCASPTISRDEQHALTLQLVTPWLDASLREDPQGWQAFQTHLAEMPGIAQFPGMVWINRVSGPRRVSTWCGLDLWAWARMPQVPGPRGPAW